MELEKKKEELQLEYNKLLSELDKLKELYKVSKQKYNDSEEKYFKLQNETTHLAQDLNNDTNQNETRKEEYINSNSSILRLKLMISNGIIFSLLLSIIGLLTKSYINPSSIHIFLGLLGGAFFVGNSIGLGIYQLYEKKYQPKLKEKYKKSSEYVEFSKNHYDKQLYLMRKNEEYNNQYDEYNKLKKEYFDLLNQIDRKTQELEEFKLNAFDIIFTEPKDNITSQLEEEISKEISSMYHQGLSYQKVPIKKRKLTVIPVQKEI